MKEESAARLASAHYQNDPSLTLVRWVLASPEAESNPQEPIKLLEVNEAATADGIIPVLFAPRPQAGVNHSSLIIEITPEEYEQIVQDPSMLPNGWRLGEEIERPAVVS